MRWYLFFVRMLENKFVFFFFCIFLYIESQAVAVSYGQTRAVSGVDVSRPVIYGYGLWAISGWVGKQLYTLGPLDSSLPQPFLVWHRSRPLLLSHTEYIIWFICGISILWPSDKNCSSLQEREKNRVRKRGDRRPMEVFIKKLENTVYNSTSASVVAVSANAHSIW